MDDDINPALADDLAGSSADEAPSAFSDQSAVDELTRLFDSDRQTVRFSRQLEVAYERQWFHWVTNRAVRRLVQGGVLIEDVRRLTTGNSIHLVWHRSYRYPKREAARVVALVEEYAHPNIGAALGLQGEMLTLEGLARHQFILHGRELRSFGGVEWTESMHDLDFIFERDGLAYGIEVKNALGYMDQSELRLKIRLCADLGIRPVFVVRMMPKTWIHEVNKAGGFVLVLKWQLYPWTHRELAKRVCEELGLPVDTPRALQDGTTQRFVRWHESNV